MKSARQTAVAAFVGLAASAALAHAANMAEALDAYRTNRVADAERQHGEVAADAAASAGDRARALAELARIDWLARGETDAAERLIAGVSALPEQCPAAALALRIFREAGAPGTPVPYADTAHAHCTPGGEAIAVRVELARNHMALVAADAANAAQHLQRAQAELAAIEAVANTAPNVGSARFSLALAMRDADAAMAAWRNYYWITDTDAPQAMSTFAGNVEAVFTAGLAPSAQDADVIALLNLLIRAGFTRDAQLIAEQSGVAARNAGNPEWRRIAAFFRFHDSVRSITLAANREIITRGRGGANYRDDILAAVNTLMQETGLSGDPRVALTEAFGVYGTVGETGGYPSMHAGHVVQDERLAVAQYGRSGELRFIVIDNMLANGFESWLWDGWAQAGGWASETDRAIVQVRSAYTGGPLSALRRARPGPARDRWLAEIERAQAAELEALGRDGVAPLPATSDRLLVQALEQIAARVGADDAAFIAEHWRATIQYSITLHEGRHALDQAAGNFSDTELEFRAKLSQIALADYPRLGLANVAGSTFSDTPHGRANRRVLQGFRGWMREHRDVIAGFDRSRPTLSQLHLLTDDQIRTAARSLDPWAG